MWLSESATNAGGSVVSEAGSFMGDRAPHVIIVGGLMIGCESGSGLVLHILPERKLQINAQ